MAGKVALWVGVPVGDAPEDRLGVAVAATVGVPLGDPDLLGVPLFEGVPEVLEVGEGEVEGIGKGGAQCGWGRGNNNARRADGNFLSRLALD